ncbi:MAG TPA: ATP-binding protein [Anaerolineae bacterium]|nr:ATP-binding protein [Anaerolineae bacterium]
MWTNQFNRIHKPNILLTYRELSATILLLTTLTFLSWLALTQLRQQTKEQLNTSLQTVLLTTNEALNLWEQQKEVNATNLAQNPITITAAQQLLTAEDQRTSLQNHPAQTTLRQFLNPILAQEGDLGFFIISPKNISLASMRDENIGTTNLIATQRPDLLSRVWEGETLFIPPIVSDVPLPNEDGDLTSAPPTMFIATPIYDNTNYPPIAIFTIRLDIFRDFSRITRLGSLGASGETYTFGTQGFLLSDTRLQQQLELTSPFPTTQPEIVRIMLSQSAPQATNNNTNSTPITIINNDSDHNNVASNLNGYSNYRQSNVIGTWLWNDTLNLGLVTEIDYNEAFATFYQTRITLISINLITILTSLFFAFTLVWNRRQTITQLQIAKQEAETANQTKTEFLANMTHELRTPLNAVIGTSSLLATTPMSSEQQDFVQTINNSSTTLLNLVDDILDLSKIEAHKLTVNKQPVDLFATIHMAIDIIYFQAANKNLELTYWIDPQLPNQIITDQQRLKQILLNLLSNAVKFTHQGNISVSVTATPLANDHYNIHISVRDTGIGIAADNLPSLFNAFNQLDTSITRQYGGTGLGLAISQQLAHLLDGHIDVTSQLGHGTTFTLNIKTQTPSPQTHPSPLTIPPLTHKKNLLLLDHHTPQGHLLTQYAQAWNLSLQEAQDTNTLYQHLNTPQPIDILIINMATINQISLNYGQLLTKISPLPLILLLDRGQSPSSVWTAYPHLHTLTKPISPHNLHNLFTHIEQQPTEQQPSLEKQPETAPPPDHNPPPPNHQQNLQILLVEDNPLNQKITTLILKRLGYEADLAQNGLEAVQATQQTNYDIVLMDIQMPQMSGVEATQHIRHNSNLKQPYIIAATANTKPEQIETYYQVGMNDCVGKPFTLQDIKSALDKAIAQAS